MRERSKVAGRRWKVEVKNITRSPFHNPLHISLSADSAPAISRDPVPGPTACRATTQDPRNIHFLYPLVDLTLSARKKGARGDRVRVTFSIFLSKRKWRRALHNAGFSSSKGPCGEGTEESALDIEPIHAAPLPSHSTSVHSTRQSETARHSTRQRRNVARKQTALDLCQERMQLPQFPC